MSSSAPPSGRKALKAGSVALVTGASRGIGKGIALRLARDGYDVAINDIPSKQAECDSVVREIEQLGRKAIVALADVTSSDATDKMVQDVVKGLGRLDCCVANAGIADVKPLLQTSEADRKRMCDVNIHGLMNTYISAAKQMIKQGDGGRIIGAASIVAFNTAASLGTYSMSKYAVRGFTGVAAKEWAEHGIRVNAYAPGVVDTSMWDQIDESLREGTDKKPGEMRQHWVDTAILLKRVSVPEDVAKLVSFLASEDGEYVTGQTMLVDGGMVVP